MNNEYDQYLELIENVEIEKRVLYIREDGTWEWI